MSVLQRAAKYHTSPAIGLERRTELCVGWQQYGNSLSLQFGKLENSNSFFPNTWGLLSLCLCDNLNRLKRAKLPPELLLSFCRSFIESILTKSIMAWNSSSTAAECHSLNRVVKASRRIISLDLPGLDSYNIRFQKGTAVSLFLNSFIFFNVRILLISSSEVLHENPIHTHHFCLKAL